MRLEFHLAKPADGVVGARHLGLRSLSQTAATREGCAQPLDSATVRAAILPRAPRGFSQQALGYALPCAARGIQVTIFADRVEIVSRTNLAAFYRVLGHAIAHEVGHVLLRSGVHDTTGLMRRVWAKSDWQRTAVTIIPFTSGQAECVRRELLRIEALKRQPFRPPRFCENEATDLPWTPMVLDKALAISDWTCPAPPSWQNLLVRSLDWRGDRSIFRIELEQRE